MIIDDLKNIDKYQIPSEIIKILKSLSAKTPTGHYEIDSNNYYNVDVYEPKEFVNCKFEAHKKYIDIQMLLDGEERLDYRPIEGLKVSEPYDEKRDVMFFENPENGFDSVLLTPFKFTFIYPHEAHKPQISTGTKSVKKVVVKISV